MAIKQCPTFTIDASDDRIVIPCPHQFNGNGRASLNRAFDYLRGSIGVFWKSPESALVAFEIGNAFFIEMVEHVPG